MAKKQSFSLLLLLLLQISSSLAAENKDVVDDDHDAVLVGEGGGPSSSPFEGFKNDKFDKSSFVLQKDCGKGDNEDAVVIDVSLCLSTPKDQGKRSPCKGEETAYSYIPAENKCDSFTYLGAGGSANRFSSRESCFASCKNTVEEGCYKPAPDTQCDRTKECIGSESVNKKCHTCCCIDKGFDRKACNETLEDGGGLQGSLARLPSFSCKANIERWFHNVKTGRCERFSWGGCSKNKNHFECREMCEQKCGRS